MAHTDNPTTIQQLPRLLRCIVPSTVDRYYGGRAQTDIWCVPREDRHAYEHTPQKPVELIERAIENSSQAGETVLDMCVGSGTTVIAAERTGRRCLAMEIDPRFCEVVIRRWEALTGRKAKKVS